MFWRLTPSKSATSVNPTTSGPTSTRLADGIAFLTSLIADTIARSADVASLVNSSASRPGKPIPTRASLQPAAPRRSTNSSASHSLPGTTNFKVNSYSIAFVSFRSDSAFEGFTAVLTLLEQLSTTRLSCRAWMPGLPCHVVSAPRAYWNGCQLTTTSIDLVRASKSGSSRSAFSIHGFFAQELKNAMNVSYLGSRAPREPRIHSPIAKCLADCRLRDAFDDRFRKIH